MVKVSECLPVGSQLQACVHDEVIFTAPAEIAEHTLRLAQNGRHSVQPAARMFSIPYSIHVMPSAVSPETLRAQPTPSTCLPSLGLRNDKEAKDVVRE